MPCGVAQLMFRDCEAKGLFEGTSYCSFVKCVLSLFCSLCLQRVSSFGTLWVLGLTGGVFCQSAKSFLSMSKLCLVCFPKRTPVGPPEINGDITDLNFFFMPDFSWFKEHSDLDTEAGRFFGAFRNLTPAADETRNPKSPHLRGSSVWKAPHWSGGPYQYEESPKTKHFL